MITAVCDSNVYISALVFGGMPREVVLLGEVGSIQLLASAALVSEVVLPAGPPALQAWRPTPRPPEALAALAKGIGRRIERRGTP